MTERPRPHRPGPAECRLALSALVVVCAHVALRVPEGRDEAMWRAEVVALWEGLEHPPQEMAPLIAAARAWAVAREGRALAWSRLRFEVEAHYARAAGLRLEEWRAARREGAA